MPLTFYLINFRRTKRVIYLFLTLPSKYFFFVSVHLLKNIRNSLLNKKKFIFPSFKFEISNISISSKEGYIALSDLHKVYNKDNALNPK